MLKESVKYVTCLKVFQEIETLNKRKTNIYNKLRWGLKASYIDGLVTFFCFKSDDKFCQIFILNLLYKPNPYTIDLNGWYFF